MFEIEDLSHPTALKNHVCVYLLNKEDTFNMVT